MCTVSVVVHDSGVRLVCNRDERRTRARAHAPRVHDLGGRSALFPVDPDGGGTWVGVNSDGLVAALLNLTDIDASVATRKVPGCFESRGVIVRAVLGAGTADEAVNRSRALLARSMFAPFRLMLLRRDTLCIVRAGGPARFDVERRPLPETLVLASSSLGDWLVEGPRQRLFSQLIASHHGRQLDAQAAFHEHRWPTRPEISVLMSRGDARTVSRTQVDVTTSATGGSLDGWRSALSTRIAMRYRELLEPEVATC